MIRIFIFLLSTVLITGCKKAEITSVPESMKVTRTQDLSTLPGGYIEVLDPGLDAVISKETQIEILAENHEWTEGPLWIESEQMLLYSDIPRNAIYVWKEGEEASIYLQPSGFSGENFAGAEPGSNGLLLDMDGMLVLCQHGDRRIARMKNPITKPEPSYATIIDQYESKRLNSPNDAIFKSNGDLYFTDPPYGLPEQMEDPEKELSFQGVYKLDTAGNLTLLTDELTRPNGIAFSPDEKTLYVANSDPGMAIWKAFDVNEDGSISNGRVFFDATDRVPNEKGLPDGLKVDSDGIIYATGPGGVFIFNPQGELMGLIGTGQATANCALNTDQTVLFITADMYLLRVKLN